MSAFVWLFIGLCWCEILAVVLQASACLLLVCALVNSELVSALLVFVLRDFVCFHIRLACGRLHIDFFVAQPALAGAVYTGGDMRWSK